MRYLLFVLALYVAAASPAFAADSGTRLHLKGNQVSLESGGKSTPLPQEVFSAQPVEGATMFFLGVGEDDGKENGVTAGLYIFDDKGGLVAFAPTDAAELCDAVTFSPDGKILAMDSGGDLLRNWYFFSFPDMEPMGSTEYYQPEGTPGLLWNGNKGVLISGIETEEHGRACGYDPCGPVSVEYYAFGDEKSTRLLSGTDLCDYALKDFKAEGGIVTARELCLRSPKAWEEFPENAPTKDVTATLP